MSHPTRFVLVLGVFLCVILVPWAIRSLLDLGGKPKEVGITVRYQIKPMMQAIFWGIALAGLAAVWSGIDHIRTNRIGSGLPLILIGVAGMGLLVMGRYEIILDQTGIHSRSPFSGETEIVWNDLSHVERLYNRRAVTTTYFIRSNTGTTIAVGDSSFDVADLLSRIEKHRVLPEHPYKRRRWYGG
jgi:hypothetical protein